MNPLLALAVDAGRRLIEDEDVGVAQISPHKGNQLALPHTERRSPFPDVVVQPFGQALHKTFGSNHTDGFPNLVVGDVLIVQPHIFAQRSAEQKHVLQHHANAAAQHIHWNVSDVHPIDGDSARLEFIKAGDQIDDGTLAGSCGPDKGHPFARPHDEGHAAQDPIRGSVLLVDVGKPHILERNLSLP